MSVVDRISQTGAAKADLGFGDSETASRIAENLNIGKVADELNADAITQRIAEYQISHVIKYEGGNTTFIWKHPVEDFNTGSQLIVHESQEAIFFSNGEALDLFGPGRHTLETGNLPLVRKFFSAPTGGVTPFHCEVYFINKTEQMAIKWGTDSKLEYVEPTFNFPIQIGASGEMSLRVEESRKLLVKIVGTEKGITQQGVVQKFRAFMLTKIKQHLAQLIKREKINIFEIDEHLVSLSETLQAMFIPDFGDYGISLERFFVTTIVKPEDDPQYKRFKELHFRQYADVAEARLRQQTGVIDQETQKQRMILEAEGLATKRQLEGYSYQDERGFDVADRMAGNEAIGQFNNMGIGLGMMAGVGGAVGGKVGGMVNNAMTSVLDGGKPQESAGGIPTAKCGSCGAALPANGKFCLECGAKVVREGYIVCKKCGKETPKGKFCFECGAPTANVCPNCGQNVPEGGKFCLECGTKLGE